MRKLVIAVDGFSSTGKSSISKIIAEKLNLLHLDTGALYRAVTYFALKNHLNTDGTINLQNLLLNLDKIHITFKEEDHALQLYLNSEKMTDKIRQLQVNKHVSFIAKQPEIRAYLLDLQKNIARAGGIIMDGRDIGTSVLPNADFKFFLTASLDERTKRRQREFENSGLSVELDAVKENLIHRDKIDSERETSPLRQAEDAILIDNTDYTKQQTIDLILKYLEDNLPNRKN